jgi:hypothetical protein
MRRLVDARQRLAFARDYGAGNNCTVHLVPGDLEAVPDDYDVAIDW